jgi:hypothetical protein
MTFPKVGEFPGDEIEVSVFRGRRYTPSWSCYPGCYPDGLIKIPIVKKAQYFRCRVTDLNRRPTVYKTAALPLS